MDPDLENIIRLALAALATGRDSLAQTELAVRAVEVGAPDLRL
jgi:hypothetical protein